MTRMVFLLVTLAALPLVAVAQEGGTTQLEEQIRQQRERLDMLEKKMEDMKVGMAKASAARKTESEKQKTLLTLEYSDGFKMYYKDPNTGNKRFALQFFGRLQMDGQVRLDGSDRKHGSSTLNTFKERRVYFGAKGTLYTYWHFVLNMELESGVATSNVVNYISNTYIKNTTFKIGQQDVPHTLEGNISNKYVRLIERSMMVNFTFPFYELGFGVKGSLANKMVNYWLLVSNGNEQARTDTDDGKSVWGRLVLLPFVNSENEKLGRIHIDVSGGIGEHNNQAPSANGGGRVSTAPGTRLITYRPDIRIDGRVNRFGAEFGWHVGPFGIWGEYNWMQQELVDRTLLGALELVGRKEIEWRGGHVTAAYFLTGEKMTFGRPKVLRPMEPGQPDSGHGAWELVGRYDWIQHNAAEGDLGGFFLTAHEPDKIEQIMAGVNWYPNSMTKISLQWQHAWWNRAIKDADAIIKVGTSRPKHQDTLMMRVQIEF